MSVIGNPIVLGINTNRNLLDNGWFTVNQREVTTWSSGYGVDRWMASSASVTKNTNSLSVTASANNGGIVQRLERDASLSGKVCTLSVNIGGTIRKGSFTFPSASSGSYSTVNITLDGSGNEYANITDYNAYVSGGSTLSYVQLTISMGDTSVHTINAVKLELGSLSTLSSDTAPNYAEELLKCQRYTYTVPDKNLALGVNAASAFLIVNKSMRAVPTVTFTGSAAIANATTVFVNAVPASAAVVAGSTEGCLVHLTFSSMAASLSANALYYYGRNGVITLSADL